MTLPSEKPISRRASGNALQATLRRVLRLPSMHLDAAEHRPSVWAAVLGGVGLGLAWGILARIWMRLVSTNPEFTIAGTAGILAIATLFGAFAGLAFAARRRGLRRWGHYVPRGLAVAFFLPFGTAAGAPLMLTVLLATLAVTQKEVVGAWVLAALAVLLVVGTDLGVPVIVAGIMPAAAVALTVWRWIALRRQDAHRPLAVDAWITRLARTILLLVAAGGFWFVSWQVITDKPGLLAPVYVVLYLILLYPLFLALRIGLEPRGSAEPRETF